MDDKYKPWNDFREKHGKLIFKKDYESSEISLMNDIFTRINSHNIAGVHKAMAFCIYATLQLCRMRGIQLSNAEIKELWGYSRYTKEVNEAFNACDELALTKTIKKGYKQIEYGTNPKGKFFRIDTGIMFGMIFRNDILGAIAFYIYSYIKYRIQVNYGNVTKLAYSYIADVLSLDESTIKKYIKRLNEYGFLKIKSGTLKSRLDEYSDFIGYETNTYQVELLLSAKIMVSDDVNQIEDTVALIKDTSMEKEENKPIVIKQIPSKPSFMDFSDALHLEND